MTTLPLRVARTWIPLAFISTIFAGLVYVATQQNLRSSANDPQIQMAEDAATALAQGKAPQALVGRSSLDIASSLSPFLVIYDGNGKPVAQSGTLNGAAPVPPEGIFAFAKIHGEDRLTWQPEPNVRQAIVLRYVSGSPSWYVLAGRSLREIEKREDARQLDSLLAWLAALGGSLILVTGLEFVGRPKG